MSEVMNVGVMNVGQSENAPKKQTKKEVYLKILSSLIGGSAETKTSSNSSHWEQTLPRVDHPRHPWRRKI